MQHLPVEFMPDFRHELDITYRVILPDGSSKITRDYSRVAQLAMPVILQKPIIICNGFQIVDYTLWGCPYLIDAEKAAKPHFTLLKHLMAAWADKG